MIINIDRTETIELYEEITSLSIEDYVYAKNKRSLTTFENDLELYIHVCHELMEDLIFLEEYELCSNLKKSLEKMSSLIDR